MVQKVLVTILTLAAVAIGLLSGASKIDTLGTLAWERSEGQESWFQALFRDGRARFVVLWPNEGQSPYRSLSAFEGEKRRWRRDDRVSRDRWAIEFQQGVMSRRRGRGSARITLVDIPLWMPAALLVIYPAIYAVYHSSIRNTRIKKGLCLKCGFDYRSFGLDICPECSDVFINRGKVVSEGDRAAKSGSSGS